MGKFILRRTGQAILVIICATMLIYFATFALGDPFASSGEKAVPIDVQNALRAKYGLDQPMFVQILTYFRNLVTGDLGIDYSQRRPVTELLVDAVPNSLRLALVAIVMDVIIGVTAGVIAAVKRYSFWDVLVTITTTLLIGIPTFVIGVLLVANLSGIGPFPPVPRSFAVEVPWFREVLLPAFTLAVVDAAFIARLMRGSMLEVLRADYIRTARAKGLSEAVVIGKHAMRNSMIPVVTYIGISLGVLFGGAIITETIYQYNGVGFLLAKAIQQNNAPVIMSVVIYGVITYVVLAFIVDVLYAVLDPRIRLN